MQLIANIIHASLEELFQKAAIEDYQEMEEFQAEMTICNNSINSLLFEVTVLGWMVFLWERDGQIEAYHAFSLKTTNCEGCGLTQHDSDLWGFHGRKLCDTCRWVGLPKSA